jgi:hypothetical protein
MRLIRHDGGAKAAGPTASSVLFRVLDRLSSHASVDHSLTRERGSGMPPEAKGERREVAPSDAAIVSRHHANF